MNNLNKENVFDELLQKYPDAMKHFCDWIDSYKISIGWDNLFNSGMSYENGSFTEAPKFHDIPFEMQLGILLRYYEVCSDILKIDFDDDLNAEEAKPALNDLMCEMQKHLTDIFA